MLQKVLIKDPGESNLIAGEQIQRRDVLKLNKILNERGKKEMSFDDSIAIFVFRSASFSRRLRVLNEAKILL